MSMGPVQVLVVGFEEPRFSGEVLAEFTRLQDARVVRLVDVLLVARTESGDLDTLELPEGAPAGLGEVAAALLSAAPDGPDPEAEEDVAGWSLADAVPPGSMAAVALIEHLWAEPLHDAIAHAGGVGLEETWLARPDHDLLEALLAR